MGKNFGNKIPNCTRITNRVKSEPGWNVPTGWNGIPLPRGTAQRAIKLQPRNTKQHKVIPNIRRADRLSRQRFSGMRTEITFMKSKSEESFYPSPAGATPHIRTQPKPSSAQNRFPPQVDAFPCKPRTSPTIRWSVSSDP